MIPGERGERVRAFSESGVHLRPGEGRSLRVLASQLEVIAGAEAKLSFGMFLSSFPPGGGMPFLHLHRSYEEAFYVLEGHIQFQLGSHDVHAGPGSAILVPAGVAHCFRNVGAGDVKWLVIAAPAAAVTAVEEVAALDRGDLDGLIDLFARHDSELIETHPHWPHSDPKPHIDDATQE
jgi:mannose-6-phosphate isomerase-like protein (cupin superfamily)